MIRRALLPVVLALTGCPLAVLEVRGGYHQRPELPVSIAPLIMVTSPRSGGLDLFGFPVPIVPGTVTWPGQESDPVVLSMLRAECSVVDPWSLRLLAADGMWTAPSNVVEEHHHWWSVTFATSHRAGTPLSLWHDSLGLMRLEPTTHLARIAHQPVERRWDDRSLAPRWCPRAAWHGRVPLDAHPERIQLTRGVDPPWPPQRPESPHATQRPT